MALHEVIVEARDGAEIRFKLPVDNGSIERHHGHSVEIDVGGLCFEVVIDNPIRLPLTCSSFQEARELAMSVSLQVMSAVLQPSGGPACSHDDEPSIVPHLDDGDDHATCPALPAGEQVVPAAVAEPGAPTFAGLFAAWREAHLAAGGAPTTPPYWQVLVDRFVGFLGHDRPADVSAQDLRAYRDHLLKTGRKLRTARHADFAALRALFQFAVENQLLAANPTLGVKFRQDRLASADGMRAFSMEEARIILDAADRETIPARRWIPWLTALTGSRVAAIANLRRQDVVEVDGIWCLRISREAGPIKTAASERLVPLHPAILKRGFLGFVQACPHERLFVRPQETGEGAYHPGRSTVRRLTEWIHRLGLDIGRAARKDPNHAWRHWFKEQAFAVGIPEKIADSIVGHSQATTGRRYGQVSLATMARELKRIPNPLGK